jgi:prevent-host-death family protein
MVETLGVTDAKRRFSELIDRVGRGERFVVTRRGKPVLALVAPKELEAEREQKPLGLLSMVGALADVEDFEAVMKDVVRQRRRSRGRSAPRFD